MNMYFYFAAYGGEAYGTCAYGADAQTCATTTTPGAPNTGLAAIMEPQVLFPLIVGLSLLIASSVYLAKKIARRKHRNSRVNRAP